MCNIYTNEHYWVIGSNTSKVSAPLVGQPCQCGSVRWGAAQQSMHPTSETLPDLLASLTPEQLSALKVLLTPLTRG